MNDLLRDKALEALETLLSRAQNIYGVLYYAEPWGHQTDPSFVSAREAITSLRAAAPVVQPSAAQVLEAIAQQWDGCMAPMFESAGNPTDPIDIGATIRSDGVPLSLAQASPAGVPLSDAPQAQQDDKPVARLQAKDTSEGRRFGLFDIVILDRDRCHDDMYLYASPTAPALAGAEVQQDVAEAQTAHKPAVQRIMDLARRFRSAPGDLYDDAYKALQDAAYAALSGVAAPAGASDEHAQLMKFYGVDSLAALVDKQAYHIEKLQAKLPPAPSLAPQEVRGA